jgi:hypothetical protein
VLRILSAAALFAVVAVGCAGTAPPQRLAVRGVPRALARDWERQASAIASAAAAGNSCNALHLANALRSGVIARQHELPRRLRTPLLTGVNNLAERITCVPTVPAPLKKSPHEQHGRHGRGQGHGQGQGQGDGNDQ